MHAQGNIQAEKRPETHKCVTGKETKMSAGRNKDFDADKVQADNTHR